MRTLIRALEGKHYDNNLGNNTSPRSCMHQLYDQLFHFQINDLGKYLCVCVCVCVPGLRTRIFISKQTYKCPSVIEYIRNHDLFMYWDSNENKLTIPCKHR